MTDSAPGFLRVPDASHKLRLCGAQALIDHPDEVRRPINFKRLALTDYKVDIPRQAKKTVLKSALEESGGALPVHVAHDGCTVFPVHGVLTCSCADAFAKFHSSVWGKKLARRKEKEGLTDFERFVAARGHAKRAKSVRSKLGGSKEEKA